MSAPRTFYVTTPIYYVNDKPHIGHAYTTLACDVTARFKRLDGYDVRFLTGTDEHGQKVEKSARAQGRDPQAFTDAVSQNFHDLLGFMNYSPDDFIRTTEERHRVACQALWQRLMDRGAIYLGSYKGWYAVRDEAYWAESEISKQPDGTFVAPTGAPVEWVEEPSYFFRLSEWGDRLLAYYASRPDVIQPTSRRNEVESFVRSGLQDLSVSRTTFDWGVPVPGDPDHVMYVWLDALTNYITALGYPDEQGMMSTYWPGIHVVGKDILRFHAVYWPAFLMAAGLEPPHQVFAHGWLIREGQKMSKSLGNVITPQALVETYGLDPVRYFLLREVPFGSDGSYSHETMVNRINSDLANDFGNLAQRVLSMVAKNCGGVVPAPGAFAEDDEGLLGQAYGAVDAVRGAMDRFAFHEALEALWSVIRAANGYVDRQAPWALRKTDPARMATVLYVLIEAIRPVALCCQPFMPTSLTKMLDLLGVAEDQRTLAHATSAHALAPSTALPKPEPVFPRYVEPETVERGA